LNKVDKEIPIEEIQSSKPEAVTNSVQETEMKITPMENSELLNEEVAAAKEDREFDWILPQTDYNTVKKNKFEKSTPMDELRKNKKSKINYFKVPSKKRNNSYPIKTMLLSIFSALVVGTIFGLGVLYFIDGTNAEQAIFTNQPGQSLGTEKEGIDEKSSKENGQHMTTINVPALNVFVVQGGVYTTEAGATQLEEQMKAKGLAATIVNDGGKFYVFTGTASSDQVGKSIQSSYETLIKNPFVKEIETEKISAKGTTSLVEARQLFDQLVSYSSALFESQSDSAKWDEIKKILNKIDNKEANSTESSYIQSVIEAYSSVEKYKSSNTSEDFFTAQQSLLNSYQLYQKWILEQESE
jgi:stage II sporulation protein B